MLLLDLFIDFMVNLVIILKGSMIKHSKLTLKSCMQRVSDFYSNIVNRVTMAATITH